MLYDTLPRSQGRRCRSPRRRLTRTGPTPTPTTEAAERALRTWLNAKTDAERDAAWLIAQGLS